MSSHLAIGGRVFDCTNRNQWCHKRMSAKEVNNEDLGPQALTALLTTLKLIDQHFHAGSSQIHGMINCNAQIHSYN